MLVYFVEKDFYGRLFPSAQEKYLSMVERLILAGICLIPGNAWPLLAIEWLALMHCLRSRRYFDLSWFSFYLGGFVAVLGGVAARIVYYS